MKLKREKEKVIHTLAANSVVIHNQHNTIKQLSSNLKEREKRKRGEEEALIVSIFFRLAIKLHFLLCSIESCFYIIVC